LHSTKSATGGIKTRHFADIVEELTSSFKVHESVGSKLNGVHFELTGDSVTGKQMIYEERKKWIDDPNCSFNFFQNVLEDPWSLRTVICPPIIKPTVTHV
jgi:hypothetical protein